MKNIEFFQESKLDRVVNDARLVGGGVLFLAGCVTDFIAQRIESSRSKLVRVNGTFYREDPDGFVTLDNTPVGAAVIRFDDSEIDSPIF